MQITSRSIFVVSLTFLLHFSDTGARVRSNSLHQTNTIKGNLIDGKLYITYDQIAQDTQALAEKLKGESFYGIVAVARGGLIPAGILAQKLGIKLVETICISSYTENDEQTEATILKTLDETQRDKRWLVVDDLVDSGETLKIIRKMLPKSYFAAIYAKPEGKPSTDIYQRECEQNTWIVFPWED